MDRLAVALREPVSAGRCRKWPAGNYHMNATQVATLAKRADVERLVLFHVSDRYRPDEWQHLLGRGPGDIREHNLPCSLVGGGIVQMDLFYDERDDRFHEARGSKILYWLDDLGASPFSEAKRTDDGFLFAGFRSEADYRKLVADYPLIRDRPEDREPLLRLDAVLDALEGKGVRLPTPRTWRLQLDAPFPRDLIFPLFVRTAVSSWKRGGRFSRVKSPKELEAEAAALRRSLGWDALILAREWVELASAGEGRYGKVPQEIRVSCVNERPVAWSFHYLNLLDSPQGFPPSEPDLKTLSAYAKQVASAFRSRLVVADFARLQSGSWTFIEAGPGSCAGTAHEAVFKGWPEDFAARSWC